MRLTIVMALASAAAAQNIETARVVTKPVERTVKLPGEILPYETVDVRARVSGYVERVLVDRGSLVKQGQLLAELSAPEMKAQLAEAQSREQAAAAQRAEAEARLAANVATYDRLRTAAQTPGAIAANELLQVEKAVEASRAAVTAAENGIKAVHASVQSLRELESYLKINAPFPGVVTDRLMHPGALAGPSTGPLLRIEQVSRLRAVVAVPEAYAGTIAPKARIAFTVPAYPGQSFSGTVARFPHSFDPKTRTTPVELDVNNSSGRLAPGMYPEVVWPVQKRAPLLVPASAVVTTTERTFVIRVTQGKAEWVNVKKGPPSGELVEVLGPLNAGDVVVKRATDEIRPGTPI